TAVACERPFTTKFCTNAIRRAASKNIFRFGLAKTALFIFSSALNVQLLCYASRNSLGLASPQTYPTIVYIGENATGLYLKFARSELRLDWQIAEGGIGQR